MSKGRQVEPTAEGFQKDAKSTNIKWVEKSKRRIIGCQTEGKDVKRRSEAVKVVDFRAFFSAVGFRSSGEMVI